ncbi:MAG TPA: isoprenylcysteine carboxylmethyltransferase family protein, partial [Chthoniobacterales bacterium]|nr:isoprenylcysteine carboxylmethyltransferase family protein [Chthoniobacterales bacterium]
VRWYSIVHLGRFFTVDVAIAADHQLIDTGPYRYVRHPSYTGALLAFIGFAMALRNWASVLIISLPIAFAFLYRINVEERALIQALGERYRAYIKRTKRLIPFVY